MYISYNLVLLFSQLYINDFHKFEVNRINVVKELLIDIQTQKYNDLFTYMFCKSFRIFETKDMFFETKSKLLYIFLYKYLFDILKFIIIMIFFKIIILSFYLLINF